VRVSQQRLRGAPPAGCIGRLRRSVMSFDVMPEGSRCAACSAFGVWRCDPPSGASGPPWPTIVFLHGIREIGNGTPGALQKIALGAGLPREIEQPENALLHDPSRFPFLVVAPRRLQDGSSCLTTSKLSLLASFSGVSPRAAAAHWFQHRQGRGLGRCRSTLFDVRCDRTYRKRRPS
jgi:hypothetical protein